MERTGEFGTILKEGWLSKQSKFLKAWRKRWFVLTPTHLYSFKEEKVYKNPTEKMVIKEFATVKSAEDEIHKEHSFKIDTNVAVFYIVAPTSAEKESWIGAIGKAMVKPSVMIEEEY